VFVFKRENKTERVGFDVFLIFMLYYSRFDAVCVFQVSCSSAAQTTGFDQADGH